MKRRQTGVIKPWMWRREVTRRRFHTKKTIGGKLISRDKRMAKAESRLPYFINAGNTVTMNEMEQAANGIVQKNSAASFALGLRKCFKEVTMQYFAPCVWVRFQRRGTCWQIERMATVCEMRIHAGVIYFDDIECWYGKRLIKEPAEYAERLQQIFALLIYISQLVRWKKFTSCSWWRRGSWFAKVPLIFKNVLEKAVKLNNMHLCSMYRWHFQ